MRLARARSDVLLPIPLARAFRSANSTAMAALLALLAIGGLLTFFDLADEQRR